MPIYSADGLGFTVALEAKLELGTQFLKTNNILTIVQSK